MNNLNYGFIDELRENKLIKSVSKDTTDYVTYYIVPINSDEDTLESIDSFFSELLSTYENQFESINKVEYLIVE